MGSILVGRGLLTDAQARQITQQASGGRPIAQLAEDLFDLPPHELASAIAEQVLRDFPYVNLVEEPLDAQALGLITAKDAWDNLVLPLRIEGGVLVCASTVETLPTAIELIATSIAMPFRFVISDIRLLEQFIAEKYHYEGVEIAEPARRAG